MSAVELYRTLFQFVISCLVALTAAAPQQFIDQFGNQQFVSDGNQFVSDGQFVSDNSQQFISDNSQQFVNGGQNFGSDNGVRTVNSRFEQDQTGNYQYAYELSDGQKVRTAETSGKMQRITAEYLAEVYRLSGSIE